MDTGQIWLQTPVEDMHIIHVILLIKWLDLVPIFDRLLWRVEVNLSSRVGQDVYLLFRIIASCFLFF
ncbi:hypothetical protein HanRHA438_Chr10g0443821 [Helianthus annuus]|nr:hypothetical protein HanRHA438_Chr10g0443821 [Helianthus annuus]